MTVGDVHTRFGKHNDLFVTNTKFLEKSIKGKLKKQGTSKCKGIRLPLSNSNAP